MVQKTYLLKSLSIIVLSTFGLMACDPAFETTAQECVTFSPVRLVAPTYEVQAGSLTNEYKLYLEDTLNSLKDTLSTTGGTPPQATSADEQDAIQFILDKAREILGYEIENGVVRSADNALDFMESLMAATDSSEVIQAFVDAKQNVATAVAKGDSFCNYRNRSIEIFQEEPDPDDPGRLIPTNKFNAQLDINFNPFNQGNARNVDQVVLISLNEEIPNTAEKLLRSFSGFTQVASENFKALGVSPPRVRQLTISNDQTNEIFFFDDDFDALKLGQIVISQANQVCRDDDNEAITCPLNTATRAPEHEACKGDLALRQWLQGKCPISPTDPKDRHPACPSDGGPAEEAVGKDDTGQVQINNFTVVEGLDTLTDVQRLRLEVDYPNNEIRLYASKYTEALLRAGKDIDNYNPDTDVIFNPTSCEQQAVLDELAYLGRDDPDFDGVRLTLIEDPNYDVGEDLEPTPIFTFQGTEIADRL